MTIGGWLVAALVIVVWGMTFASTRVLLVDFSALEKLVVRFALAWVTLAIFLGERRAVKGTRYCRQHAAAVPAKKPFKTCQAIAENGEACKEKPLSDSRYCEKHGK